MTENEQEDIELTDALQDLFELRNRTAVRGHFLDFRTINLGTAQRQGEIIRRFLQVCEADHVFPHGASSPLGKVQMEFSQVASWCIEEYAISISRGEIGINMPVIEAEITEPLAMLISSNKYLSLGTFIVAYRDVLVDRPLTFSANTAQRADLRQSDRWNQFAASLEYYRARLREMLAGHGIWQYYFLAFDVHKLRRTADEALQQQQTNASRLFSSLEREISISKDVVQKCTSTADQIDAQMLEWKQEFEAMVDSARQRMEISALDALWEKKRREHRRGFWGGVFILLCATLGTGYALWSNWSNALQYILDVADRSAAAAALLVSAPLLLGFLCLRVASRFITTSLLLHDDARQRRALAATLTSTIADRNIELSKEMKAVAFEALFRPAPGQPSDESVHPLLDLLKNRPG